MHKKKIFQLLILLLLCTVSFVQCTKEKEPNDAITLNMLNEENGKTLLGSTDVYINQANNFKSNNFYLVDFGDKDGLGTNKEPTLDNIAKEVAVTPKHLYYIYHKDDIREFPSGKRALFREAKYYKTYVIAPKAVNNILVGATVKYTVNTPIKNNLPKSDTVIGKLQYAGSEIKYTLPRDAECILENPNVLQMKVEGTNLTISLLKDADSIVGPYGNYKVYIRSGSTYTVVNVEVLDN